MLAGKTHPLSSLAGELVSLAAYSLLSVLWLSLAAAAVVAGLLGFNDPERLGGLRTGLPAGFLIIACWLWLAYFVLWIRPRRTITEFSFDGSALSFQLTTGWQRKSITEIVEITRMRPRRRRYRTVGWSLSFRNGEWVILPASIPNAAELIAHLTEPSKRQPSNGQPRPVAGKSVRPIQDGGLSFGD